MLSKEVNLHKATVEEFNEIYNSIVLFKELSENEDIVFEDVNRFSDWIETGVDFDTSHVLDSTHGVLRLNPHIDPNVFHTLHTCSSKLGEMNSQVARVLSKIVWSLSDG